LQVTLMSIEPGDEIGLEVHPNEDQFLRVEDGNGKVMMGDSMENLSFEKDVSEDFAIMIPAGKWHNVINTGNTSLKLYSIYAPPSHPHGAYHQTKEDALAAEGEQS
jgi:mannose-6-phosphate isomerase-like protein (cupin superfamily)